MPSRPISDYMSHAPHSIGLEQSLAAAERLMRLHNIRHLPVLHGGELVGVLSERDIALVESFESVDAEKVTVEEAMAAEPYAITPATPLDEVVRVMADHKYGSAVIMEGARVVGMFTVTDGMRTLASLLETGRIHGQDTLRPSEVRKRVLTEHTALRAMLDDVEALAHTLAQGDASVGSTLVVRARELQRTLGRHLDHEDVLLIPILRETDAFGPVRAERLTAEHERQRNEMIAMLSRLLTSEENAPGTPLAEALLAFAAELRTDMDQEEKALLSPELFRDDPIRTNVFSG